MNDLKNIIKKGLTETGLKINSKHIKILSMTCFWSKINFSAIVSFYGRKFYCFYDNSLNDIVIQNY